MKYNWAKYVFFSLHIKLKQVTFYEHTDHETIQMFWPAITVL